MEQCNPIEITAKEILMELISKEQEKYPFSLKVPHLMELLNASDTAIKGIGWRINRDVFLTWLYSGEEVNK